MNAVVHAFVFDMIVMLWAKNVMCAPHVLDTVSREQIPKPCSSVTGFAPVAGSSRESSKGS